MNKRQRLVSKLIKQRYRYFTYRLATNTKTQNYTTWLRNSLLSIRCPIIHHKSWFKLMNKRKKQNVRVQITEPNGSIIKEVEYLWLEGVEAKYEYEGKNEKES